MKGRRVLCGVLALGLLLAATVEFTQAQGPGLRGDVQSPAAGAQLQLLPAQQGDDNSQRNLVSSPSGAEPNAAPVGLLNYQGKLLRNGSPYNGSINITFRLYTVATGGSAWWSETQTVQVNEGLFNVMLGAVTPLNNRATYFSDQQWLGVQPAGAASELTPRQPLGAVGYAMNLMPGATLVDTNPAGIYSYSFWVASSNHAALYARSDYSTGIYGGTTADNRSGVIGGAGGSGNDSHGVEASMSGASGSCAGGATECGAAFYTTASGDAYASWSYGQNRSAYIGVQGGSYYGLWVYSLNAPNGYGIYTNGASTFDDYVTFSAGKSGYVVDIALNDGLEPLEKGDVVVISGYDAPVIGNIPVVRVRKANEANSQGVMGVVDVQYVPCVDKSSLQAGQACGGFESAVTTIQPGKYLGVVTLGAYEGVKVDAASGPIRPGDLLATSASKGHAAKAAKLTVQDVSFYAPGTIIGKALGSLDNGTGVIPVFVSSR
jgi:hypothetical protein